MLKYQIRYTSPSSDWWQVYAETDTIEVVEQITGLLRNLGYTCRVIHRQAQETLGPVLSPILSQNNS